MKQQFRILFLIGICILLSGCWDKKELTDLSIVNAIGIDKTENGRYLLTFQIINPGNVAAEQSGGGGGSGGIPVTLLEKILQKEMRPRKSLEWSITLMPTLL
ncbi:hypothetical protein ACQKCU_10490 [Heyndrickxia sporothermodurans]